MLAPSTLTEMSTTPPVLRSSYFAIFLAYLYYFRPRSSDRSLNHSNVEAYLLGYDGMFYDL